MWLTCSLVLNFTSAIKKKKGNHKKNAHVSCQIVRIWSLLDLKSYDKNAMW